MNFTVELPQIPRASNVFVLYGNTIGSQIDIGISRAVSSFTHTLTWRFGGRTGTIAESSSSASITWTPPLDLSSQIPNSESGTGTLTCITYMEIQRLEENLLVSH